MSDAINAWEERFEGFAKLMNRNCAACMPKSNAVTTVLKLVIALQRYNDEHSHSVLATTESSDGRFHFDLPPSIGPMDF
ncbi:hypothetical protein [Burkholderia cepacia]|uniref:hypothetical protein n=1 Tax=Burkholderia cepacia TaxID=292 RepID=UPI00158C1649|nr:hypothetical protein [Burkholderia cepacia]MCA8325012.1 hypothetical protein [Burkholderia cepacia]